MREQVFGDIVINPSRYRAAPRDIGFDTDDAAKTCQFHAEAVLAEESPDDAAVKGGGRILIIGTAPWLAGGTAGADDDTTVAIGPSAAPAEMPPGKGR